MNKIIIGLPLLATTLILAAAFVVVVIPASASAQLLQAPTTPSPQQQENANTTITRSTTADNNSNISNRIFENKEDGISLHIPQGWVVQDNVDIPSPFPNVDFVAMLCPEDEALPGIGGEYDCQRAQLSNAIYILRWTDLQSLPELQDVETITTNDLVALRVQMSPQNVAEGIRIQNSTDIDEFRKIVDMTYTLYDDAGTPFSPLDDYTSNVNSKGMFVLSQDRNTGYMVYSNVAHNNFLVKHSPALQEVFDSFELIDQ